MKSNFDTHCISQALEQRPFNDFVDQEFFAEWCKVHDNLCPQFLPRKQWEKLDKKQILEKKQDQLILFLPQDLKLWEMMDIIREIDQDTLKRKPEKQNERANQLLELGRKFEKSGLYLANFFPSDDKSEEAKLAQFLAQQFYSYGCSLQQKTKKSDALPHNISLSEEEMSEVDQRLLGKQAYEKRLAKLWKTPSKDQLDAMRKGLLTTAFKALRRESSKEQGEKPRELKKGPIHQFQEKTQNQLVKTIQTPETELYTAIFRRGKEKLFNEMPAPNFFKKNLGVDLPFLKTKLTDALKLSILKSELEKVRKTGDKNLISEKELAIAKKIQKKVSSFNGKNDANIPLEMVKTAEINCLGAALLGGLLLEELDIQYLAVDLPLHTSTILITSDGKWYRQDFTPCTTDEERNYTKITPALLENKQERKKLQKKKEGILIFKNWNPYEHIKDQLHIYVASPEKLFQSTILNNIGSTFFEKKDFSKSEKFYEKALQVEENDAHAHNNLGNVYDQLGKHKKAIEAYQNALKIISNYSFPYNNLGNSLLKLEKYEELIQCFQKAIELNPDDAVPYNNLGNALFEFGNYKEAILAYQKFIQLAGEEYKGWIEEVNEKIKKLQKKLSSSPKSPLKSPKFS